MLGHALELARGKKNAGEQTHRDMQQVDGMQTHGCNCTTSESTATIPSADGFKTVSHGGVISSRLRKSPFEMIEFEYALEIVKKYARSLGTIQISVDSNAVGFVLAKDVESMENGNYI